VLVSVAIELKEGAHALAGVFKSRDLSAVRRLAFRDRPANARPFKLLVRISAPTSMRCAARSNFFFTAVRKRPASLDGLFCLGCDALR
jgi:hypothetical protein